MSSPFQRILAAEIDGRTQNIRYRQNQLHRLQSTLLNHVRDLKDAILADSGNTVEEAEIEIYLAFKELCTSYLSLNLEESLEEEYRVARGRDNPGWKRGVGIVYIVPTTHTLFYSVIAPMSAAIAAGNCVIVELPNTTSLVSLLRKLLVESLDGDTFAISDSRPDEQFLKQTVLVSQQQLDPPPVLRSLISPSTARTVAVVDRTANVVNAAGLLVSARFAFSGRSHYAPDVVLVNEYVVQPFLAAVVRYSSRYLAENGTPKVAEKERHDPKDSLLKSIDNGPETRVVLSGTSGGLVELKDRKSALLQTKINERLLLVHAVTSLDDAIDLSNSGGTLAATYAFASPAAGKYLVQFIDSHVSFVNHVPWEMLVGPAAPANTPVNPQTRYTIDLFQVPRPQFAVKTTATKLIEASLLSGTPTPEFSHAWTEVLTPLPPTKQKAGKRIGFFEQGIITGGIIVGMSFAAVVSTIGYYGISFGRKLLG